ncbi:DUF6318 family protein [Georgenia yuyongxinii]|uniref:DUF6318 domain-containing protein n=1 Tax=Georgenia yuyongxinii TaxID=2589797 RepID=A0A552WU10_9MICO|nr:DUF6318 family protein [Georgenia yuyongxinii]TRW46272.1 hypothetical protein FJ693_05910 [Georgenia yuyongxinii]
MALGEGRRRVTVRAVAVVAAVMMLAACSATADPAESTPSGTATASAKPSEPTEPSATVDPTVSAPPEAKKPERPDAMRRDDVAGAEAAAQYFLLLYPYVYASGDLAEWEAMSHPECVFCAGVFESVEELHGRGGYAEGGEIAIERVAGREPLDGNDFYRVDISASEASSQINETEAAGVERSGGKNLLIFAVAREGGSWRIRGVQVESPASDD